ncbi:MAG: hypothetical protein K9J12_13595 [Melioribacteraceae bacterium]|nr:hypothetical protein [Melioribacteraceae bacterium]MCF8263904.1 hypothetical protein [Melioribacteraceae bacterium]MCF8430309.1 hypothetical protein [Melioribacteraceae bacterium]
MKTIFLFLSLVLLSGCGDSLTEFELDEEFKIKYGEKVRINGAPFEIEFIDVAEDSRCPRNLVCVWAGNAEIVLAVADERRSLNTTLDPKSFDLYGYKVDLIRIEPYPEDENEIPKEIYEATLSVGKL